MVILVLVILTAGFIGMFFFKFNDEQKKEQLVENSTPSDN